MLPVPFLMPILKVVGIFFAVMIVIGAFVGGFESSPGTTFLVLFLVLAIGGLVLRNKVRANMGARSGPRRF